MRPEIRDAFVEAIKLLQNVAENRKTITNNKNVKQ